MKKNIIGRNLLISAVSAIVMCAMIALLLPAMRLTLLSILRSWAAANHLDSLYREAIEAIQIFADESDYCKWLVSCGQTMTGKVIRLSFITVQSVAMLLSVLAFSNNFRALRKRTAKLLRKQFLNNQHERRRFCK